MGDIGKINIRLARYDEAFIIGGMWKELMEEIGQYPFPISEDMVQRFSIELISKILKNNFEVYVAEMDNRPVGFILMEMTFLPYTTQTIGHCHHVYVDKMFRTFQAGKKLIDRAYKWCANMNLTHITFNSKNDPKIIKRWEMFGYKPINIGYVKEVV